MWSVRFLGVVWVGVVAATVALGHDHTRPQAVKKQRARPQQTQSSDAGDSCRLTIRLFTNTPRRAVPGVIRITERDAGKPLQLKSLIQREQGWHSMPAKATIPVPVIMMENSIPVIISPRRTPTVDRTTADKIKKA